MPSFATVWTRATTMALVATLATSESHEAQEEPAVLWQDNFDGAAGTTPNSLYWSYDTGAGGWGNFELQDYTTTNADVSGGTLKIEARRSNNDFTSSRIHTQDKVEFMYGTMEARIKVPNVTGGLWPAFWTLGASFPEVPWPACGEFDAMEVGQGSAGELINNRVVSAAHWQLEDGSYASFPGSHDYMSSFLYQDFHVYKLEWTPQLLITYIDEVEIWRMDIGADCPSCEELHQKHFLILNMAVGGGFTSGSSSSCGSSSASSSSSSASSSSSSASSGGCPAPTADEITAQFPAVMEVDYVRILDNGFTKVWIPTNFPTFSPTNTAPKQETPSPTLPVAKIVDTLKPTLLVAKIVETSEPTLAPTEDTDDYYDDNWKGSSKGGKGKGGKGSGGELCGGGKMSGKGMMGGKMSKSKSGKSKGKSGKGKGRSGDDDEYSDCGSSTSLRTTSRMASSAPPQQQGWSLTWWWSAALVVIPALSWAY